MQLDAVFKGWGGSWCVKPEEYPFEEAQKIYYLTIYHTAIILITDQHFDQ